MWVLFSKYILVGIGNTLLTLIVIFTLMHFGINLYISNAVGYIIGIVFSFILNSLFTFSAKMNFATLLKFLIACLIAYFVNLFAINSFLMVFPDQLKLAQLCGMGFYTVTGFILNKFWVMKMVSQTIDNKDCEARKNIPSLTIVVPCYNEAEAFVHCVDALSTVIKDLIEKRKILENSHVLFVDDGSKDNTWYQIKKAAENSPYIQGLKLSRNRGHQTALIAGLTDVKTDVSISIDADLQDDINCIEQMIDKYMSGADIVYGVRNDRSSDSIFKRTTANTFYGTMAAMGVNQVANHADYRLLSKRALACLLEYKEQNLYIRGLIPLIGFHTEQVTYVRDKRVAGESKYPLKKMLGLALEGITSLTVTPLRLICVLGFLTCCLSLLAIIYILIAKFSGQAVEGWSSVIISIFFLSGVQLLCLGVIGEYVGKIYMETKQRPKFFIDDKTKNE